MLDLESRHLVCDNRHTVRVKLFQFGFIILFCRKMTNLETELFFNEFLVQIPNGI